MHIKGLPEEFAEAECLGNYASVFKNIHNGILVTVKVIRILASDTDSIFRVSSFLSPSICVDEEMLELL